MDHTQRNRKKTNLLSLKKHCTDNSNDSSSAETVPSKKCKLSENNKDQTKCSSTALGVSDEITLSFDVNSYFAGDSLSQFCPDISQNNIPETQNKSLLSGTGLQLTDPDWDEDKTTCTRNDDNLTQFYESSQVLNQIESVINSFEFNQPFDFVDEDPNTKLKVEKVSSNIGEYDEAIGDKMSNGINHLFKSSRYKKEVSGLFDQLETTICQINYGQDITLQKDTTINNSDNILSQSVINYDWDNESRLITSEQKSAEKKIDGKFKQVLLDNLENLHSTTQNESQLQISDSSLNYDENYVHMGPFYGLPNKVQELIDQYKGIDKLYDWQDECLKLDSIRNRKNLVYALPTSGGKTLVSEILIFKEILCRRKNAIFILPYVSLVQEKVWALSPFALALNFLVEEYAAGKGTYPPRRRREKRSVYVATIEKALGLINALTETNRIDEIGLVVVDELHLLGEPGRGAVLEQLLTKIMYSSTDHNIHIVGMSATIGNLPEVCAFLNASSYTQDFRPVELKEFVKCGNQIFEIDRSVKNVEDSLVPVRNVDFNYSEEIAKIDPDRLTGLVMEVIPKDSCLIFCASKKNCENVSLLLCRIIPKKSILEHEASEKQALLSSLETEGALCPILKRTIPFGIAYHHSGLTGDERKLIEDAFRVGTLCVICCTSTLAAGVNLPAKRVILRSPYIGRDFLTLSRYKQMSGRAGRAGLGEKGESILICTSIDLTKVVSLLYSPMDHVYSRLLDNLSTGLREFILSCIGLGIANNRREIRNVIKKTLLAVQKTEVEVKKATDDVITDLFKLGALQLEKSLGYIENNVEVMMQSSLIDSDLLSTPDNATEKTETKQQILITNDTRLTISKLGLAAIKGGLNLDTAHILYDDLVQAQSSLVLLNCLHLLYLVTPYELSKQIQPSLQTYYSIYMELPPRELATAQILGLDEACCSAMMTGRRIHVKERILNRFYLTLILHELWEGKGIFEVAEKYQVNRGLVQQIMISAATFASNVVRFCEQMDDFWAFTELLKGLGQRLQHCCAKDLEPLMVLPAVKQARARQLLNAGYRSLQNIATADPSELMNKIEHMSRRVANQLVASAKMLLLERVENLREEAQDVLDGIGGSQ